jgi:hypothetical protein
VKITGPTTVELLSDLVYVFTAIQITVTWPAIPEVSDRQHLRSDVPRHSQSFQSSTDP